MPYTPKEAWLAYDNQDYTLAGKIWIWLMAQTQNVAMHNRYRLNYTYVLTAQHRFREALQILCELFDATEDPLYLHHMSYVAQEQGDLASAKAYLDDEYTYLDEGNYLALAAHACALGRVLLKLKDTAAALEQGHTALELARVAAEPILESAAHHLIGDILTMGAKDNEAKMHYATAFAIHGLPIRHPGQLLTRKFTPT